MYEDKLKTPFRTQVGIDFKNKLGLEGIHNKH